MKKSWLSLFNKKIPVEIMTDHHDLDLYLEDLNGYLIGPQSVRNLTLIEIRSHLLDKRQSLCNQDLDSKVLDQNVLQGLENFELIVKDANSNFIKKSLLKLFSIFIVYSITRLFFSDIPETKSEIILFLTSNLFFSLVVSLISLPQEAESYLFGSDIDKEKYTVESTVNKKFIYRLSFFIFITLLLIGIPLYWNFLSCLLLLTLHFYVATSKAHVASDSILIERFFIKKNIPWTQVIGLKPLGHLSKLQIKIRLVEQHNLSRHIIYTDGKGKQKMFLVLPNQKNSGRLIGDVIQHSKKSSVQQSKPNQK